MRDFGGSEICLVTNWPRIWGRGQNLEKVQTSRMLRENVDDIGQT